MGRSCSVCSSPHAFEVNEALILERASYRDVAGRFGLEKSSLARHRQHIPQLLLKACEAQEIADADTLLEEVRDLQRRAYAILDAAEETGQLRTALAAIKEARGNLELLARLLGELKDQPLVNINLTMHPQWLELRDTIVTSLRGHPEALREVAGAIRQRELMNGSG